MQTNRCPGGHWKQGNLPCAVRGCEHGSPFHRIRAARMVLPSRVIPLSPRTPLSVRVVQAELERVTLGRHRTSVSMWKTPQRVRELIEQGDPCTFAIIGIFRRRGLLP